MQLYNLTLQKATNINHAVHGNYSGQKQQEIAVARGTVIEILKPDPNTGKVATICSRDTFSIVRSMISFRLTGGVKVLEFSVRYVTLTKLQRTISSSAPTLARFRSSSSCPRRTRSNASTARLLANQARDASFPVNSSLTIQKVAP